MSGTPSSKVSELLDELLAAETQLERTHAQHRVAYVGVRQALLLLQAGLDSPGALPEAARAARSHLETAESTLRGDSGVVTPPSPLPTSQAIEAAMGTLAVELRSALLQERERSQSLAEQLEHVDTLAPSGSRGDTREQTQELERENAELRQQIEALEQLLEDTMDASGLTLSELARTVGMLRTRRGPGSTREAPPQPTPAPAQQQSTVPRNRRGSGSSGTHHRQHDDSGLASLRSLRESVAAWNSSQGAPQPASARTYDSWLDTESAPPSSTYWQQKSSDYVQRLHQLQTAVQRNSPAIPPSARRAPPSDLQQVSKPAATSTPEHAMPDVARRATPADAPSSGPSIAAMQAKLARMQAERDAALAEKRAIAAEAAATAADLEAVLDKAEQAVHERDQLGNELASLRAQSGPHRWQAPPQPAAPPSAPRSAMPGEGLSLAQIHQSARPHGQDVGSAVSGSASSVDGVSTDRAGYPQWAAGPQRERPATDYATPMLDYRAGHSVSSEAEFGSTATAAKVRVGDGAGHVSDVEIPPHSTMRFHGAGSTLLRDSGAPHRQARAGHTPWQPPAHQLQHSAASHALQTTRYSSPGTVSVHMSHDVDASFVVQEGATLEIHNA